MMAGDGSMIGQVIGLLDKGSRGKVPPRYLNGAVGLIGHVWQLACSGSRLWWAVETARQERRCVARWVLRVSAGAEGWRVPSCGACLVGEGIRRQAEAGGAVW